MRSIGVEVAADYTFRKLRCLANASWKRIVKNDLYKWVGDDEHYGDPTITANATVAYQLLPTLRLHANAHYIGRRNLDDFFYPYRHAPAVILFDLGANWSWRNLGVNVNIHNLLGTQYWQSGLSTLYNVPQQRRWFLVELTYKI